MNARYVRLAEGERPSVRLLVDGEPIEALQGDTLRVAVGDVMAELISTGSTSTAIEPFHIRRFATSPMQRSRAL